MPFSRVLLTTAATALLAVGPAHAALLVHEPFNYTPGVTLNTVSPNGSTLGRNTGVAYSGVGADGYTVLGSSLAFDGLLTSGGSVSFAGGTKVAAAQLALDSSPYKGLLYVSYLVSLTGRGAATGDGVTIRVADNNTSGGDRFNLQADSRLSSTAVGINYGAGTAAGDVTNSSVSLAFNTTYLMIARFSNVGFGLTVADPGVATAYALTPQQFASFMAAGGTDAYLNTTEIGTGADQITARVLDPETTTGTFSFSSGNFFALVGVAATGTLDEVRYGSTLQDVTPVPEPSTALLLAAAAVGGLTRRRRRA